MQSIKSAVMTALQTSTALTTLLGTGTRIFFQYPASFTTLPVLSYFEIDNFGNLYADNQEIGSEMLYQVDVWSKTSTTATAIALAIDTIMTGLDFTRSSANDLYEVDTKIFHKAMTYRLDYSDPTF